MRGKTLGLVGFGRIARETARRARALLDVRVAYHSRSRATADDEAAFGATYHDSLAALLAASDIVSLHCPGGAATRHLLNRADARRMKPTAILINTARGSVVDESALADALSRRVIAAAGLDVYEGEPAVHPALLNLENVVLLPHLGSATVQTRTAMGMRAADNLDAFFSGQYASESRRLTRFSSCRRCAAALTGSAAPGPLPPDRHRDVRRLRESRRARAACATRAAR